MLLKLFILIQVVQTLVVSAQQNEGLEAGFILIQGAQIDSVNYKQFTTELQSKFPGKLWVGVAQFPLSTPEPLLISQQIDSALDSLKKSGCSLNKNMSFFFAGHSLGGIILQDYIFDPKNRQKLPVKVCIWLNILSIWQMLIFL